jgi:hypothetical protein
LNVTTDPNATPVTTRLEAENIYSILTEVGTTAIAVGNAGSPVGQSNSLSVRLPDTGDKIRLNFSITTAGQYRLKVRVRSGNSTNSTLFWPDKYLFWVNGASTSFVGDPASISALSPAFGGAYFGTMVANVMTLNTGAHSVDVEVRRSSGAVDYLELEYIGAPVAGRSITTEQAAEAPTAQDWQVLKVYPNPIEGEVLFISFAGEISGKVSYQLTDMQGRTFASGNSELSRTNTWQIPVKSSVLKAGTYILRLKGAQGNIQIFKIVKH